MEKTNIYFPIPLCRKS